ncbi:MAG: amino acid adenylation domain-containing protein [Acidobacteriota bacterium]
MPPLSCLVVGDSAVTVSCLEILRARGLPLVGVVTADPRVGGWAVENGLPTCHLALSAPLTAEHVTDLAAGTPIDLLWSIHNLRRLLPDVLALPRRLAINYHDAPLPRYAGLHATSWAIANRERSHGITWHRADAEIDAGDVLIQRTIEIGPHETAWTLNNRCSEAAAESFGALLDALLDGSLAPRPQDLAHRTFFPGWRTPRPGCVIPWDQAAEQACAFVRGLDFGIADNPLGFPKLLAPDGTFLVGSLEVLAPLGAAAGEPGRVTAVTAEGIDVTTATSRVRVTSLVDLSGRSVRPTEVGLAKGTVLPSAAPREADLERWERSNRRHERFWSEILSGLSPLAPPGFESESSEAAELETSLAPELLGSFAEKSLTCEEALLVAVCAGFAAEIDQPFDLAVSEPGQRRSIDEIAGNGLLAPRLPLRVGKLDPEEFGLSAFAWILVREWRRRRARGAYAIDLPLRIRRLRLRAERGERIEPAVALDLMAEGEDPRMLPWAGAVLAIGIDPSGRMLWRARRSESELRALAGRFLLGFGPGLAAEPCCETARRQILSAHEDAEAGSLVARFRSHAARAPEALALAAGEEAWSYGALAARIDRLAAALVRRGVFPERLVALRLQRLADQVTAIFAVLAAGGAFVVLESADPPGRLERVLAQCHPDLILSDRSEAWLARYAPVHSIGLAEAAEGPAVACDEESDGAGGTLAYVAFTSGSGGGPKGVAVERRAISKYIGEAGRFFAFAPGDRVLQLGSAAFDLAYEQIFGALCNGASLIGRADPAWPGTPELFAQLDRLAITVLDLPTAVWEQLSRDAARTGLAWPRKLRLVILGGERATASAARAWKATGGGSIRLINTYGPTEATIVATWWEAGGGDCEEVPETGLPIGRPIPGTTAWVLDEDQQTVPEGDPGELWIGGTGLARGYHRRPDRTAERFVSVAAAKGARLYRTGDQVRRREDGHLEFLGRLDRQLKIAGRRIEPGEIEATLDEIPGVAMAAVAAVASLELPDLDGAPVRLAAWVVLQKGAALAEIEAEAARRLPAFVHLAGIFPATSLPLSPAGKVDFEALRANLKVGSGRPRVPPSDPPREGSERTLGEIWRRVLGLDAIRRNDDFFNLGGDSLAAARLLAAIEEQFDRRLRIAQLLKAPTLSALAGELGANRSDRKRTAESSCRVDLQPEGKAPGLAFVHGLGGHLLRLVPLARAFAPDQPVLGLQSPGLDDDRPIPRTIEELAAVYLAALREAQGPGPHRLVGMSFGGVVALEMARQAVAVGESVAMLALLDTDVSEILPAFRPARPGPSVRIKAALRRFLGDRLGRARRRLRHVFGRNGVDEVERANEYRNFTAVLRANEEALGRYQVGRYAGRVIFFEATPRPQGLYDELVRVCGCDLERVRVPGDHLSMLEPPHVAGLAAELRRRVSPFTSD